MKAAQNEADKEGGEKARWSPAGGEIAYACANPAVQQQGRQESASVPAWELYGKRGRHKDMNVTKRGDRKTRLCEIR